MVVFCNASFKWTTWHWLTSLRKNLKMSPQLFSNTYNKAHDKFKNKLEMEIFVKTHTQKKLWSNETTTKLRQSKAQNWNVAEIWSSPTTLKWGETRRRKAKVSECRWKRINRNARELSPTWVGSGTCMGVVGTMDPHADGHVMTGYEIFITWVRFTSRPVRGMLKERGWGQNRSWRVLLYRTHSFPLACLIFSHFIPWFNKTYFADLTQRGYRGWKETQRQGDFKENSNVNQISDAKNTF